VCGDSPEHALRTAIEAAQALTTASRIYAEPTSIAPTHLPI
jgi:hypothetical protein